MFDYGPFKFASKQEVLDKSIEFWNPEKTNFWQKAGIDLVIDKRQDYFIYDMSNHWFPSVARAALSEALIETAPGMKYAVFGAGGADAVEIAIKSARYATKRHKIASIINGYHGHSGLSVATGADRFSKIFLADQPEFFVKVPFNELTAMETALREMIVQPLSWKLFRRLMASQCQMRVTCSQAKHFARNMVLFILQTNCKLV